MEPELIAVEGYTLRQQPLAALRGPSPLLRLASDERLIELTRSGQQAAFEALVARYHARLLAFCRHMLRSREDAEDVLQEVFAAAFNAIMADTREINARPWLYRIARNRSLNHLRRNTAIGVDSMDAHFADAGPVDQREGAQARGVPPAARRHRAPARDAALGPRAARDGRAVL
jgi:DNA-directed RNA polymerase specialized sigma24 family protein